MRLSLAYRDYMVAAFLLAWPLAVLGEVLVTRTHHRPLGAATFASVSVIALVLMALLPAWLRSANARRGRLAEWTLWALAGVSFVAAALRSLPNSA